MRKSIGALVSTSYRAITPVDNLLDLRHILMKQPYLIVGRVLRGFLSIVDALLSSVPLSSSLNGHILFTKIGGV